jgi:hypothetical protein
VARLQGRDAAGDQAGLLILTSLSIIWDFGVFTQPYLLIGPGHQTVATT